MEDMDGGTFTISNGGVFGSLMGTPIINPPQSAILGMHGIFDRPVAVKGEVEAFLIALCNCGSNSYLLELVSLYYSSNSEHEHASGLIQCTCVLYP